MMAYIDELVPSTTNTSASDKNKDAARLAIVEQVLDASGNGMVHYACANGHLGEWSNAILQMQVAESLDISANSTFTFFFLPATLNLLLPFTRLTTLLHQNNSGNTPLHWAGLNGHLDTVKTLLSHIESLEKSPAHAEEANQIRQLTRRRDEEARKRRKEKEGQQGSSDDQQQQQQQQHNNDEQEQHRSIWDIKNNFGRGPTSESQLNDQEAVVQFLLTAMAGSEAQQQKGEDKTDKTTSDADEQEQILQKTSELNVADQKQ